MVILWLRIRAPNLEMQPDASIQKKKWRFVRAATGEYVATAKCAATCDATAQLRSETSCTRARPKLPKHRALVTDRSCRRAYAWLCRKFENGIKVLVQFARGRDCAPNSKCILRSHMRTSRLCIASPHPTQTWISHFVLPAVTISYVMWSCLRDSTARMAAFYIGSRMLRAAHCLAYI